MTWLFPDGNPTNEAEAEKYMTTITVPTENGTMSFQVHQKLATEFEAVFKDLKDIGFPVRSGDTAGFNWRLMASGTGSISHHSYGGVVDLNWQANPASYAAWSECPFNNWPCNQYSVTDEVVQIWKKHGFYWGGDWNGYYKDYMHFTYTNH
jgi:predicted aminopeptidase